MNDSDPSTEHPNPDRWWFHRRIGYYAGIVWGIVQTFVWIYLGIAFTIDPFHILIGFSYSVSMVLILAYYGNNTVDTWISKKYGK